MELVAYGVNHFNPLHRAPLRAWIAEERQQRGVDPAFIAPEWSQEDFMHIALVQRPRFRTMCQAVWPGIGPDDLEVLERSLGFEADTHWEVCPRVPVAWLDDPDPDITNYAADRLALYQAYLEVHPPADNHHDIPQRIAQRSREIDHQPVDPRPARDTRFAFKVHQTVEQYPGDWAVVVVGWIHSIDEDGSMVRLLSLLGHDTVLRSMRGM